MFGLFISQGQTFVCDMVFKCTGMTPNTSLTKTLFGSTTFDESNLLKVNNFLQVEGVDDIYAIGDCVNTPEPKMAVHAENHAKLLAANFMRQLKDQTMQPYKQGKTVYLFFLKLNMAWCAKAARLQMKSCLKYLQ